MAALGLIIAFAGSMVGLTVLRGLVLQALWSWFVVDTFHVSGLSLVAAIGLSLVVSFLTYQYDARDATADDGTVGEKLVKAVVVGLIYNGFCFILGAIVHGLA